MKLGISIAQLFSPYPHVCNCVYVMLYFSVESGTTANSGDMAKVNKKLKDLEHRLSDKESKIMEITTELMENVKKNRDVSYILTNRIL